MMTGHPSHHGSSPPGRPSNAQDSTASLLKRTIATPSGALFTQQLRNRLVVGVRVVGVLMYCVEVVCFTDCMTRRRLSIIGKNDQ